MCIPQFLIGYLANHLKLIILRNKYLHKKTLLCVFCVVAAGPAVGVCDLLPYTSAFQNFTHSTKMV